MEVAVTVSVETDLHGHIDKLYVYATESVLCMGLPNFQHCASPNLHMCTGTYRSLCVLLEPKCTLRFLILGCHLL
jgi:hypothetical protein